MSHQQRQHRGRSPLRHVQNARVTPDPYSQTTFLPQMSQRFPQHNPALGSPYGIHNNGLLAGQQTGNASSSTKSYSHGGRSRSNTRSLSPNPAPASSSPSRYYTAAPTRPARSPSPSFSRPLNNTAAQAQPQASSRPSSPLIPVNMNITNQFSAPFSSSIPLKPTTTSSTIANRTEHSHRRDPWLPLGILIATITFVITAWFARATFTVSTSSSTRDTFRTLFHVDIGDTLTILALLSGILAFLLGFVVDNTLDVLQWSLICRVPNGMDLLSVLAISSTTGAVGTLGLFGDKFTPATARSWAAGKMALRIAVWTAGIVLFINTSLKTVYRSEFTYTALAGVGGFDGRLVAPFLDNLNQRNANLTDTSIPYSVSSLAHNLVVNPQHSIASSHSGCNAEMGCDSYTLPGGLATASPLPPRNRTELPVVTLNAVPATRVDFHRNIASNDTVLTLDDCDLYSQNPYLIALRFCLAPSTISPGSILAAIYVCDLGTNHTTNECLFNRTIYGSHPPTINTTFSLARLSTSMVVSRANLSILALTEPSTEPISDHTLADTSSSANFVAYRSAINWMLNNTAAGIPAPSGMIEYFWSAPLQLGSDYWSPGPRQAFESLLAYPLWFWQANNLGNIALQTAGNGVDVSGGTASHGGTGGDANGDALVAALQPLLSNEYNTQAGVGGPAVRIVVDEGMFIAFVVLVGLVLLVGWVVVAWLWVWSGKGGDVKVPKISSYAAVDMALRTKELAAGTPSASSAGSAAVTSGFIATTSGLDIVNAGDKAVRRALKGRRVVFDGTIDEAAPLGQCFGAKKAKKRKTRNHNLHINKNAPGKLLSSGSGSSGGGGGLTP